MNQSRRPHEQGAPIIDRIATWLTYIALWAFFVVAGILLGDLL